jgi:hypothetical protein
MSNLKDALGGATAIRHNANTLVLRTKDKPLIDPEKQPNIYAFLKKLADKEGISVEEYQIRMDTQFL